MAKIIRMQFTECSNYIYATLMDQDTHNKLKKLAIACDMTKTMMAYEIIKIVVNHTDFIDFLQERYNKDDQYRIVPIRQDGKTYY